MKTIFYVFVLALFSVSCNNNDDSMENTDTTLAGSWSLVNASGGFAGVNDDFEVGLITWDFNHNNLELTVTNANTANVIFDGLPSGTYNYVFTTTGEDVSLVINSIRYDLTTLSSSELVLDEGVAADGFLLTFSR